MTSMNISNARTEIYKIAASCIKYNDVINISTKDGNVIMISEKEYNNLLESLYLAGVKNLLEDVDEVVNTPTEDLKKDAPWK